MRRLLSPSWLALHVVAVALVLAFCWLGWWQWDRATSPTGSARSYGYALQWPVFAAFVVFMWVKMVREDPRPDDREAADAVPPSTYAGVPARSARSAVADDDEDDEELAAYNRYLAGLNARAGRRHQYR